MAAMFSAAASRLPRALSSGGCTALRPCAYGIDDPPGTLAGGSSAAALTRLDQPVASCLRSQRVADSALTASFVADGCVTGSLRRTCDYHCPPSASSRATHVQGCGGRLWSGARAGGDRARTSGLQTPPEAFAPHALGVRIPPRLTRSSGRPGCIAADRRRTSSFRPTRKLVLRRRKS
jgi:hypothetical protein